MVQIHIKQPIEYLKKLGPQKGDLLKKEAGIFTFNDLLEFSLRHIDKTQVTAISNIVRTKLCTGDWKNRITSIGDRKAEDAW